MYGGHFKEVCDIIRTYLKWSLIVVILQVFDIEWNVHLTLY